MVILLHDIIRTQWKIKMSPEESYIISRAVLYIKIYDDDDQFHKTLVIHLCKMLYYCVL